ncbi:hypothetical protein CF319_g6113 [Tilletia indica]|nr:hypothetical protein CF319_g6113 [Tilletia indica]
MQKDVRDAVAHVSCGVAPPKETCLYSNITSIKNQDGTQRRVQHRHRGKSNADHVGAHLTTIFDLPTDYVRELVLSEGMGKSYDKDSQSCLLWGLSHKIKAFRDIRPLADQDHQDEPSLPQASSSTSAPTAPPTKRTRVNFDHVDFHTVDRSLSDEGALSFVSRRELSKSFTIDRPQLNYYVRNRLSKLLQRKQELQAQETASP